MNVLGSKRPALCAVLVAVTLLGFLGERSQASFPGRNGLFAVDFFGEACDPRDANVGCFGNFIQAVDLRRPAARRALTCREDGCNASSPAWSPNGRLLAYDNIDPETRIFQIVTVAVAGGEPQPMLGTGENPAWGPGGQRLVFERDVFKGTTTTATDDELFLVDRDGSHQRRLTYGGGQEADWSQRGEIAFVRQTARYSPDVYIADPDTGGIRRLTKKGENEGPSWSPDGQRLAIEFYGGPKARNGIRIIDRKGKTIRHIAKGGRFPIWSPDGKQIAFERGGWLNTVSSRGGHPRRLFKADYSEAAWQSRPR